MEESYQQIWVKTEGYKRKQMNYYIYIKLKYKYNYK